MDSWDLYRTDLFSAHILITGGFAKPMDFKPPNNNNNYSWTASLSTMHVGSSHCSMYLCRYPMFTTGFPCPAPYYVEY